MPVKGGTTDLTAARGSGIGRLLSDGGVVSLDVELVALGTDDSEAAADFDLSSHTVIGAGGAFPLALLPFVTDTIK